MKEKEIGKADVTRIFTEYLDKHPSDWIFMMEVPEEKYLNVNIDTVKVLADRGYSGIYISLHKPYKRILSLLKAKGIDTSKLFVIDAASSHADAAGKDTGQCVYISKELGIDELTKAVYQVIPRIKGKNKFLFLDSITTLTLYQPLSEALRFAEFLSRTLKKEKVKCVVSVAKNLAQKKFIRDIVVHVDEVISAGGKNDG